MLELTLDKVPGGDTARRHTLVRISLSNTGEGLGDVKVYAVELAEVDERGRVEVVKDTFRTHRSADEGALRLAYRALGIVLGERG